MVRVPYFQVLYNGKNISEDISKYLLKLSISDGSEADKSDEVSIELEDTDGLWSGNWYPTKGDKLSVSLGYVDESYDYGVFQIDEIEWNGPPDVVTIKGLSAGIKEKLRTKRSAAHENKTLKQIAQAVADQHGYTVTGTVPSITIGRVTQNRETDLAFMKRVGKEYGAVFTVKGTELVFTSVFDLHKQPTARVIDRTDVAKYNFKDSSYGTAKKANVTYYDPLSEDLTDFEVGAEDTEFDFGAEDMVGIKEDTINIRTKAENKQQAEAKAKASLHEANSKQVTGSLEMEGDPLLMAGQNVTLSGFGKLSGVFNIVSAEHSIDRQGYTCSIEIKKVSK